MKVVTLNLNRIIDSNHYPVIEAKNSDMRHRSVGIGVQGLSDTFVALSISYDSQEAKDLNIDIFETIYHAALESSCELAAQEGYYETWPGSAGSNGILQCDMWGITPTDRWDWMLLRAKIAQHGLRNSLLVASIPTDDISQISGFSDSVDPFVRSLSISTLVYLWADCDFIQ